MLEAEVLRHEVILVNDGSRDASWEVISERARTLPSVVVINLLRNSGQHSANLCGFRAATGDYVITIDDDLQNPPEEIPMLVDVSMDGYDVVYGRFAEKQASGVGTIGSRLISRINRNTVQLGFHGCSLGGCLVLGGPSLCRSGGCRIWCRWGC